MLSQASTSYLFFVRVKAICSDSRNIAVFFGLAWLANLGLSIFAPLAIKGDVSLLIMPAIMIAMPSKSTCLLDIKHIGPTGRCITTVVLSCGSITLAVNTTYDSLIFLTISSKIISQSIDGETWAARMRCFFTGEGLPSLLKGLLQSGQVYYL